MLGNLCNRELAGAAGRATLCQAADQFANGLAAVIENRPNQRHCAHVMQLAPYTTPKTPIDTSPPCDDCRLPTTFRAEVADLARARPVRVFQCQNCAKVIWAEE